MFSWVCDRNHLVRIPDLVAVFIVLCFNSISSDQPRGKGGVRRFTAICCMRPMSRRCSRARPQTHVQAAHGATLVHAVRTLDRPSSPTLWHGPRWRVWAMGKLCLATDNVNVHSVDLILCDIVNHCQWCSMYRPSLGVKPLNLGN